MIKRLFGINGVVLAGALVIGVVVVLALPNSGEAAPGKVQRAVRGLSVAEPASWAPNEGQFITGELSESEIEALLMALDDEYQAWSIHDQVIAEFGAVRPFTSIQQAEEKHIAALVTLLDRYGLSVPANEWPGNVPSFDSLAEACEAGVQAEVENAALYDQLLGMVDNRDVIQVFTSLQRASLTKHLPAFERCAR